MNEAKEIGMFTYAETNETLWQQRAMSVDLKVFKNKPVSEMTDEEIEEALQDISRITNVYYVWG